MLKKKMMLLLLTGAMLLGLCSCGDEDVESMPNTPYAEINQLLDQGNYDSAIQLIREMRDAEQLEANRENIAEADAKLIEQIAGEYRVSGLSGETMTINTDMTLIYNESTCLYEITHDRDQNYLKFSFESEEYDYPLTYSWEIKIDDNGFIWLNDNYVRIAELDVAAKEYITPYIGTYESYQDGSTVVIKDESTASVDGKEYPLEYSYSPFEKCFCFFISGYDHWDYGDSRTSLYFTVDDKNFITMWSYYYRVDQLDLIEITADNLFDYFEWGDWYLSGVSRNAFDEVQNVSIARYLKLKDQYQPLYYENKTSVALEIEYKEEIYSASQIMVNLDTEAVSVDLGEITYHYDPSTRTISSLGVIGKYDDNGIYTVTAISLLGEYINLSVTENTLIEGSTYSFTTSFDDPYLTNGFSVLRSATTLALKKSDL